MSQRPQSDVPAGQDPVAGPAGEPAGHADVAAGAEPRAAGAAESATGRAGLTTAQRDAVTAVAAQFPVVDELGRRFAAAGHRLHLVGGTVRDALLGRLSSDLDFTTDARPADVLALLDGWADATWTTGIEFGTVGAARAGAQLEITTYRSDLYDGVTRNPEVTFGDTLDGDLRRRDFVVNAMALSLPGHEFVDPFGGLAQLAAKVLDTPGTPEQSFRDDPLRMMRAARFAAQLGFTVAPRVVRAMTQMSGEITRITPERINTELTKLMCGPDPRAGLVLFTDSGLADHVLPELPALRLERDEHHQHKDVYQHTLTVVDQAIALEGTDQRADAGSPAGDAAESPAGAAGEPPAGSAAGAPAGSAAEPAARPDLVLRLAALLHDIGKPATRRFEPGGGVSFHHHEVVGAKMTRKRLRELRYPKAVVDDVAKLVFLHLRFHGYGTGEWTDSAVRRYVTDAGELLPRLHKLVRADCTTRNPRRRAALQRSYDDLERRISEIAAAEDLARIRPDLDGNAIMELLGCKPGPVVGRAWNYLKDLRLEHGPMDRAAAEIALLAWAAREGLVDPVTGKPTPLR